VSYRESFRRLAGISDERAVSVGSRALTEEDLRWLEERKPFDVGTRRQWKRGEHLKTSKGWKRLKKSERTTPHTASEPQTVASPQDRMAAMQPKIAAASAKSPLLGNLVMMGSFMGGNGPGMSKQPGFKYGSSYEAVAAEGEPMKSEKMPAALKKQVMDDIDSIEPEMKQCYYNAQKLAMLNPERYTYCDGYANAGVGFPVQHGWCVVKAGGKRYVVDPTLRRDHNKAATEDNLTLGEFPEGREYVGKEFPTSMVAMRWGSGMAGSLYDWPPYYPLMRENPDWKTAKRTKAVDYGD
jgi:hypothetical protein